MVREGKRERPHFGAGKLEPRQRVGSGWLCLCMNVSYVTGCVCCVRTSPRGR